jgi:transposase
MDSASYSKENLGQWGEVRWLTRVPETIGAAKRAIRSVATKDMTELDNGYRIHALSSNYGQVQQRWLVVYSPKAEQREMKRLDKQVERAGEKAEKALRQLTQIQFECEADAHKAGRQLNKKLKWHTLQTECRPIEKYLQPGRPAKGVKPIVAGWKITGRLIANDGAIAQARQWLGRFILATNELDEDCLPDTKLLSAYKAQGSSVERGFRFLKDPMFFADSLFLKSPARIMAMIMVMGLSLLVYALAERELRRQLAEQNEAIPDQKGKPTQTPTMRRVAQMFEGIDILVIRRDRQIIDRRVLNLSTVRLKIIRLFGPEVEKCYLLEI